MTMRGWVALSLVIAVTAVFVIVTIAVPGDVNPILFAIAMLLLLVIAWLAGDEIGEARRKG